MDEENIKMESNWTIETLKEFFEQKFESLSEAVKKQEAAYNDRFASVNEFRLQLSDQSRTFIPRQEYENMYKNISEKLEAVAKKQEENKNIKMGGNILWLYIVSIVSFLTAIVTLIINLK